MMITGILTFLAITGPASASPCQRLPGVVAISNQTPTTGMITATCPGAEPANTTLKAGATTTVSCTAPGPVELQLGDKTRSVLVGDCVDVVWDGSQLTFR